MDIPLPDTGGGIKSEFQTNYSTGSAFTSMTQAALVPERAENNRLYYIFYRICTHPIFALFIILMIIWNTLVLASDTFPADQNYEEMARFLNTYFTYCFLAEMLIKLLGLVVKEYARDKFNLFDAAIVILSMVEIALEELGLGTGNAGAFSAFRSIRLLRTFKLVRSWKEFH